MGMPAAPRLPRRWRRPRQRLAPGAPESSSTPPVCSETAGDSGADASAASGTASTAIRRPLGWRSGRGSCFSPGFGPGRWPRSSPRPPVRAIWPLVCSGVCRTSRGGWLPPVAAAFSSSSVSSASSSSRKSVTYRKASRSRPTSTKADCMPGRTRVTRPL